MRYLEFKDGGALDEHHFYVERPADQQLTSALVQGEYCYVLAPRQMGKSSLRYRVSRRLKEQAIHVANLDLTALGGKTVSDAEWYYGILYMLSRQLGSNYLTRLVQDFWNERDSLAPVQRFSLAIKDLLLAKTTGKIAVLIDEIDAVRGLTFSSDDFFAAIRACYNARPSEPEYRRLCICLFGVAQPSDLIIDDRITPFNIGKRIDLADFDREQVNTFADGLLHTGCDIPALLDTIYYWTNGHPYMTQRLCAALASYAVPPGHPREDERVIVERLVQQLFLWSRDSRDSNLAYVDKRFEKGNQDPRIPKMLDMYSRLLRGEFIVPDGRDEVQTALQLTGIAASQVGAQGRALCVRNRIFGQVFGEAWVRKLQADRYLSEPTARWLDSGRDESFALRGRDLALAEQWAEGRDDLTVQEQLFLRSCSRVARVDGQVKLRARTIRMLGTSVVLLFIMLVITVSQAIKAREEYRARDKANRELAQKTLEEAQRKQREAQLINAEQAAVINNQHLSEELLTEQKLKKEKERLLALQLLKVAEAKRIQSELASKALREELAAKEREAALIAENADRERIANQREAGLRAQVSRRIGEALAMTKTPDKSLAALVIGMEVASTELNLPSLRQMHLSSIHALYATSASQVPTNYIIGHATPVKHVAYSPGGGQFLTLTEGGRISLFDTGTGNRLVLRTRWTRRIIDAQYCTSEHIAVISDDNNVGIIDTKLGHYQRILGSMPFIGKYVRCSPDGRYILLVSEERKARLVRISNKSAAPTRLSLLAKNPPDPSASEFGGGPEERSDPRRIAPPMNPLQQLDGIADSKPVILEHSDIITSANFSSDSRFIVTSSLDGTIHVFDTEGGRVVLVFYGNPGAVLYSEFSPDGSQIISAGKDGAARIIDVASGRIRLQLAGHTDAVTYASISPDGRMAVTASADKTAIVWSLFDGRPLFTLVGHAADLTSAQFDPKGSSVLTASRDRTVRSFAAFGAGAKATLELVGHVGAVRSVNFSPDGSHIVTAGQDQTVRIFDAKAGRPLLVLAEPLGEPTVATYSRDGKYIAVGRRSGVSQIVDATTGRELARLSGHHGAVTRVEFSPDSRTLATASEDKSVRIWDVARGSLVSEFADHHLEVVTDVNFSPDGRYLVSASADDTAALWNLVTGRYEREVLPELPMLPITSARFSPDGSLLAVTVADALLRLFYVGNGRLLNTYGGQRGRLNKARFDSEGVWLLTASDDGTAGVFKVDDRSEYLRLHGHSGRVLDADFSPDGRFVVTAGSDGMALVHPLSPEALFRHACCVLRSYRDFTPLPVADDDFQNANQFCRPEWQRADCAEQR